MKFAVLTVEVETSTGKTYKKRYPEKDPYTGFEDGQEHDEFLDIIGKLLNIPRRTYQETTSPPNSGNFTAITPPYFAKTVTTTNNNLTILSCTEDDYYYYKRLHNFIESTHPLRLFHTVYDEHTSILPRMDYPLPSALVENDAVGVMIHIRKDGLLTKSNMNIDTTGMEDFLRSLLPVTREVMIYYIASIIRYSSSVSEYVNTCNISQVVGLNSHSIDGGVTMVDPMVDVPVQFTEDGTEISTILSDLNGRVTLDLAGISAGTHTIHAATTDEYSEYSTYISSLGWDYTVSVSGCDMDISAWDYILYWEYTGSSPVLPSNTNDMLDTGCGYLVYTPILNTDFVDTSAYTIDCTFYYTTFYSFLCLARVTNEELDQSLMPEDMIRIYPRQYEAHDSSIETEHHVTFKFLSEKCYLYYDGIYTGLSYDYTDFNGLLSFCGYNALNNTANGLKLESIDVSSSVDIQSAPTGRLDVLDTYNIDKWAKIQSSSTNTPPSTSSDGYDCGRNFYNVFEDYILPQGTTNKTVEIEFNTDSSSFRLGLVRYWTTNVSWGSTYFASNQATVSTGTHILKFIADNNGEWTTYLDGTRTSTASFTLPNESKLGAIQYTNGKYVKILGVRVYDNNE